MSTLCVACSIFSFHSMASVISLFAPKPSASEWKLHHWDPPPAYNTHTHRDRGYGLFTRENKLLVSKGIRHYLLLHILLLQLFCLSLCLGLGVNNPPTANRITLFINFSNSKCLDKPSVVSLILCRNNWNKTRNSNHVPYLGVAMSLYCSFSTLASDEGMRMLLMLYTLSPWRLRTKP